MKNLLFLLLLFNFSMAQVVFSEADKAICKNVLTLSVKTNLRNQPINEVLLEVAKSFIGTDYEANTLRNIEKEELIIHLSGLDCYTFLESSFALALLIKEKKQDIESFSSIIEKLRYRNGKLDGYVSRLHYFSDWIYDLEKRGLLKNITEKIGGTKYDKTINFMSVKNNLYPELVAHPEFIESIKTVEQSINSRENFYVPQDKISSLKDKINSGDLIGITSGIAGLDIAHVGIALKKDGELYFLHSPMAGKKVQITEIPLAEYIKGNKNQTGIMVARIVQKKK